MEHIYLDHCATTPMHDSVFDAMRPWLQGVPANPSSRHYFGRRAHRAVESARECVAALVGAKPADIIFTGGATEASNLAIKGVLSNVETPSHIITTAVEHKAVLATCEWAEKKGYHVDYAEPTSDGVVSVNAVKSTLQPETALVAVMWCNNETGALNPITSISQLCMERRTIFFTDATQAVGKVPIDMDRDGIDMLALSAHKINGPMGVGALVAKASSRRELHPVALGGGQERGLRSGTLNVAGIVGFGAACKLALDSLESESTRLTCLKKLLEELLKQGFDELRVNGSEECSAPHCLNVMFPGVDGEALVANLSKVSISTGSACNSTLTTPSHVLLAMGLSERDAFSSVRLSLGRTTRRQDVEEAAKIILQTAHRLKGAF